MLNTYARKFLSLCTVIHTHKMTNSQILLVLQWYIFHTNYTGYV